MTSPEEALIHAFADAIVETVDGEEVLALITPALNAIRSEAWEAGMTAAKLQAAGIKPARNPYRLDS